MSTFWFGFDRHWRAPGYERSLFGPVVRMGWVSFGLSPYDPPDFIKAWHSRLETILAKQSRQTTASKGQMK